ncbi:MAG: EamA family transporter, partial [Candidatus Spyradocola sp.]
MKYKTGVAFALLAAVLYALSSPLSKLLLERIPAAMMAAFLYLGAGAGVLLMTSLRRAAGRKTKEQPLTRKELPYTVAMVLLDVAAPVCLMLGLTRTTA